MEIGSEPLILPPVYIYIMLYWDFPSLKKGYCMLLHVPPLSPLKSKMVPVVAHLRHVPADLPLISHKMTWLTHMAHHRTHMV